MTNRNKHMNTNQLKQVAARHLQSTMEVEVSVDRMEYDFADDMVYISASVNGYMYIVCMYQDGTIVSCYKGE